MISRAGACVPDGVFAKWVTDQNSSAWCQKAITSIERRCIECKRGWHANALDRLELRSVRRESCNRRSRFGWDESIRWSRQSLGTCNRRRTDHNRAERAGQDQRQFLRLSSHHRHGHFHCGATRQYPFAAPEALRAAGYTSRNSRPYTVLPSVTAKTTE